MTDCDSPWKEALDIFFKAFLELFFPAAVAEIMPEIRKIRDADQLEKILRAAKTVANPEELRKLEVN
jgi:hypothetical protein